MADRDRLDRDDLKAAALDWRQPVDAVSPTGLEYDRTADAAERERLREVCDLVAVERMEAHFTVKPWRKTGFSVKGRVSADVVQACVVSLEPVAQTVDEAVDVRFVPAREAEKWRENVDEEGEIVIDPEAEDPPEFFEGNALALGALAAEYFALGLDPYPRAPGVSFQGVGDGASDEAEDEGVEVEERQKPFAALKEMMKAKDKGGK